MTTHKVEAQDYFRAGVYERLKLGLHPLSLQANPLLIELEVTVCWYCGHII